MTKIYVVTSGIYSDYNIVAIFSTEELANAFVSSQPENSWSEYDVTAFGLDPDENLIRAGQHLFFCRVSEAGNILECYHADYHPLFMFHRFDHENNMSMLVWAKDEEHARKIMGERHAIVKAGGWNKR